MKIVLLSGIAAAVVIAAVAAVSVSRNSNETALSKVTLTDVEALGDCEITKNGIVKLKCSGIDKCSTTYMGYKLECDGKKD